MDVFWDNLQVTHSRGALLEESHYYPGGLVQSGISYKAAGKLENKKSKFNGYELNTDFDINLYESFYRSHDPQLGGRFWQIDPKPDFEISPYAAMGNNPVLNSDPLGDTLAPILKGIGGGIWNVAKSIATALMPVEKPQPGTVDIAAAFGIITKDQAKQEIAAMNSRGQQGLSEAITESFLGIAATAGVMTKGRSNAKSGLGDLTKGEVKNIQKAVNDAGRPVEVVGSAATGTRRGVGSNNPIGKGSGTRSDIDYVAPPSSIPYIQQGKLPSIDPKTGIIPGYANPFQSPIIRFEPNAKPIFIPKQD